MSTASEQAGAYLAGNTRRTERTAKVHGETGDYKRLRELIGKDDLTADENAEFDALAEKRRTGTLEGSPRRQVYERQSVGGERDGDGTGRAERGPTASEQAARMLQGRG